MEAFSSKRLYSFTIDWSVIIAFLFKVINCTFSQDVHLLSATYACPGENICESKETVIDGNVSACVLCTVRAKALCNRNCVLVAYETI